MLNTVHLHLKFSLKVLNIFIKHQLQSIRIQSQGRPLQLEADQKGKKRKRKDDKTEQDDAEMECYII